jgi:hypothetical protein
MIGSAKRVCADDRLGDLRDCAELMGRSMTDPALPARFAEGDFSVGRVLNRTFSVFVRNFLTFFIVTAVASLPTLLLLHAPSVVTQVSSGWDTARGVVLGFLAFFVGIVLYTLSQAVILYGAFQDMRGRPVSLTESLAVGLRRFFPIVGLAISMTFCLMLGIILLIVPGLMLMVMWFVATPACVVERLGPFRSMRRSADLTRGHRWKVFGLMLVVFIVSGVVSPTLEAAMRAVGGSTMVLIGTLIWNGIWGAFYAITAVVAYHDLRVAKEGIDIEQIAAIFD